MQDKHSKTLGADGLERGLEGKGGKITELRDPTRHGTQSRNERRSREEANAVVLFLDPFEVGELERGIIEEPTTFRCEVDLLFIKSIPVVLELNVQRADAFQMSCFD